MALLRDARRNARRVAHDRQGAAALERARRKRGERRSGGRRRRRAHRRALVGGDADCVRARRRESRRRIGARRQHRPVDLRRVRARAPRQPARRRPAAGPGRPHGRRRASGSGDRDREGARAARHTVPLGRRGAAVGESRRVRPRPAHRRFRSDQPIARGHDRRAAASAARAGSGGHQARGGRRRRARLQPVRLRAVAVCAVRGAQRLRRAWRRR